MYVQMTTHTCAHMPCITPLVLTLTSMPQHTHSQPLQTHTLAHQAHFHCQAAYLDVVTEGDGNPVFLDSNDKPLQLHARLEASEGGGDDPACAQQGLLPAQVHLLQWNVHFQNLAGESVIEMKNWLPSSVLIGRQTVKDPPICLKKSHGNPNSAALSCLNKDTSGEKVLVWVGLEKEKQRSVFRIPSFRTKSCGQCSFSYQASVIWNQLLVSVHHSTSVSSFKFSLKNFSLLKNLFFSIIALICDWCVCVCVCACMCESLCVQVCMCLHVVCIEF